MKPHPKDQPTQRFRREILYVLNKPLSSVAAKELDTPHTVPLGLIERPLFGKLITVQGAFLEA